MTRLADLNPGRVSRGRLGAAAGATIAVAAAVATATAAGELVLLLGVVVVLVGAIAALRWPVLLLYAYVAAVPFNFALPPGPLGTVARAAGIVFVVGYVLLRVRVIRLSVVPLACWAFVGWSLASSLWAVDAQVAFSAWFSLAQLLAATVVVASIIADDPGQTILVLWVYSLAAATTAAVGAVTYLQGPTLFLYRATGFESEDPAMFASVLLPAIFFLLSRVDDADTSWRARLLALVGLALCVAAVGLSGTRSAWIGLGAGLLVALLSWPKRRLVLGLAVVCGAVGLLEMSVPGVAGFLADRAATAVATGGAGRVDIWVVGLAILASAPLAGVGFANFPLAFSVRAIQDSGVLESAPGTLFAGRAAHSTLLGPLVETGIVGAVLLVWTGWAAIAHVARSATGNVVRPMLVSLYVQAMFLDLLGQKQLWLMLGVAFGLAASWASANRAPDNEPSAPPLSRYSSASASSGAQGCGDSDADPVVRDASGNLGRRTVQDLPIHVGDQKGLEAPRLRP